MIVTMTKLALLKQGIEECKKNRNHNKLNFIDNEKINIHLLYKRKTLLMSSLDFCYKQQREYEKII